ncbi:MAG TPA: aminoacyl-tRNA deacylase [Burkholderiaceae bacterium]|nr:aminoacyl-tRNA deacylase [Burkholderiaceae bacterium]
MARKGPQTPATAVLAKAGVEFTDHLYRYEEHGGTRVSARELGVDEHAVVKTLVMQDEQAAPLLVLMHGDLKVSTKALARAAGVKSVEPCAPATAQRHTGYLIGGTSPFGTRKPMPVFAQRTIVELPRIYINGGRRGYLVGLDPRELLRLLSPALVDVALPLHAAPDC